MTNLTLYTREFKAELTILKDFNGINWSAFCCLEILRRDNPSDETLTWKRE